jgi:signal transduction histidine kinase
VKRFSALAFAAVMVATAVLAVLGYLSLQRWQTSADLLFRQQARDMATMAAEKVEMAIAQSEGAYLADLQRMVLDPGFGPAAIEDWRARTPLVERVAFVDRAGRVEYQDPGAAPDAGVLAKLLSELSADFWDRGGRRHFVVGDRVVLGAVVQDGARGPLLALIGRNEEVLTLDVLARTLGGLEGQSALAVLDPAGRAVYASQPIDGARRIVAVNFGDALPAWQVALYQPAGLSPTAAVRGQSTLFMTAFALLLAVIVAGLAATHRAVRRESEMARLKADFVANVSHDLKTPLSLIRMFAETLEMNRVSDQPTRQEYYRVITREAERLTRLIDNVLDFSRIDGGHRRYAFVPCAVEPIVQDVLEAFRYPLAQGSFKVDLEVDADLPEVSVDAEAIKQALGNLVENAIKYSPERRHLTVMARREGAGVRIDVADEGLGIPAPETERIFEKFYRVGRSETQGQRGSGMGLALVKHIAEAHGGRVSVVSHLGAGSRFSLHLPSAAGDSPDPSSGESSGGAR